MAGATVWALYLYLKSGIHALPSHNSRRPDLFLQIYNSEFIKGKSWGGNKAKSQNFFKALDIFRYLFLSLIENYRLFLLILLFEYFGYETVCSSEPL
jgi:hypothetical protein